MKLRWKPILVLPLFIALIGVWLLWPHGKPEAGWYSDDWQYRKKITVTNNTSTESNKYVTLSSFDTSDTSRFQADCGDVRFVKQNGEILPYYVVSGCGTASTSFHINFDSLVAGAQDMYIYYGNPSVADGFQTTDFSSAATNATVGSPATEEKGLSPAGYWKFDESSGTLAYDSSANKNNGTLGGVIGSGAGNNVIEQQINIIDQEYSTTGSTMPTDNSLGLIGWDGSKYNGESVYFEAVVKCSSCTGGNTQVTATLFDGSGTAVASSGISTTSPTYVRIRTASAITANLTDGANYTVRLTRDATGGTAYIKAARLIVIQTAATLTNTETQVEIGDYSTSTSTSSTSSIYSSEYIFNSASTIYIKSAKLDNTHFVTAYSDEGNSSYGTAVIGSISGNTISYGSEVVFNTITTNYISVAALDSTHFVIAYRDTADTYGRAIVGVTNGGTTISSFGAESTFNANSTTYISVATIDSTHFVIAYLTGISSGDSVIGVTNGNTTIDSYGAVVSFHSGLARLNSVSLLDSTHFVVAFQNGSSSNAGSAIIGNITSGTTLSYGSINTFNSGQSAEISTSRLDSTHFVVTYQDMSNSSYGTANIGTVSGTTITSYGGESVFNSLFTDFTSVSALDSTHFIVAYRGSMINGNQRIGTVSGGAISEYTGESTFNSGSTSYISVFALNSISFIINYPDSSNSDYGTGIIGLIGSMLYPKYYSYDNSKFSGSNTAYFEATINSSNYGVSTTSPTKTVGTADSTAVVTGVTPAVTVDSAGLWTGLTNGASDDNSNIAILDNAYDAGDHSQILVAHNFGFSTSDVPSGSTILGVTVTMRRWSTSGVTTDYLIKLCKWVNGSTAPTMLSSTNESGSYSIWSTTERADVIGGASRLWNATLTDSDIRDSNFGVCLVTSNGANNADVSIDQITMKVNYSTTISGTAYAELYNRTNSVIVGNGTVSISSTAPTRVRSSALTTDWDTSNADEYEARIYTSNSSATTTMYNAKIIIDSTSPSGLTSFETVQQYNNTAVTDNDSTYTSQLFPNSLDKANWQGGTFAAYFESTIKTDNASNAYYGQLDYGGGTGAVTASDLNFTRKQSSNIWSSLPGSATDLDVQFKNASTSTTTSSNSWLLIQASGLGTGTTSASTIPDWKTGEFCMSDSCLYFDGTSDNVIVENASAIDLDGQLSGGVTFSFWVKPTTLGEGNAAKIFSKGTNTFASLAAGSNSLYANLTASLGLTVNDATVTVNNGLKLNEWHYVTIGYTDDSDDEITVYIDGKQQGVSTNGSGVPATDTNQLLIGGTASANFHGFIDEFKINRQERSADQVKLDYQVKTNPKGSAVSFGEGIKDSLNKDLVGYWKMDENTGNTILDSSGNLGTSSTFTGNTAWSGGKFGPGLTFDGTDDVVRIPENTVTDLGATTDSYTVSTWFKSPLNANPQLIVAKESGTSPYPYRLWTWGTIVYFDIYSNSQIVANTDGSVNYSDNTWHLITGVRDASNRTVSLYVDGDLKSTVADTSTISAGNNADISIGNGSGSYITFDYSGSVDDVRIYNRALSSTEIKNLYNWAPGPVAYWKLDENSGTTIADSSGVGGYQFYFYGHHQLAGRKIRFFNLFYRR